MTKKTVKQLDIELSQIKEEYKSLNTKFDDLASRYVSLEKKYEESLFIKKKLFNVIYVTKYLPVREF